MSYPSVYDNDNSLLGDLQDRRSLLLTSAIDAAVTEIPVDSTEGVGLPTYLRLEDELVYVAAANTTKTAFTGAVRGALGSTATSHVKSTVGFLVLTSEHLDRLKDAIANTQKYQGLVGTFSARPVSPSVGEVYIATDTKVVYVCLVVGVWSVLGGVLGHADTNPTDDHTQYLNDTRAQAWHIGLAGGHVVDGDSHTHIQGAGAGRIRSGLLADKPAGTQGDVYFSSDTQELYVAKGAADWALITGAPAGVVIPFMENDLTTLYAGACPPGWTRFTELDGLFPVGAPAGVTSPMSTGGALTHAHTYTDVPAHTHTVSSASVTTSTSGSHDHNIPASYQGGGSGLNITTSAANTRVTTSSSGSHTHSGYAPSQTSGQAVNSANGGAGSASGATENGSNLPPFQEVVFCKKL